MHVRVSIHTNVRMLSKYREIECIRERKGGREGGMGGMEGGMEGWRDGGMSLYANKCQNYMTILQVCTQ